MDRTWTSYLKASRRSVLLGSAAILGANLCGDCIGVLAQSSTSPVGAALDDADFLNLSHAITGYSDLSAVTAARILAAMRKFDPTMPTQAAALFKLAGGAAEPEALLQVAGPAGLRDTMLAIIAAWYTGTIGTGRNAVVVSYADALMYQPVRDGLRPPTYCNGPNWWTGTPPVAGVTPPAAEKQR
jgi:fructose 5-dehydrogenase small subunit